jgi:ATP-binding cassette, subfamily C, bacterial
MKYPSIQSLSLILEPFRIAWTRSVVVVVCLLLAGFSEAVGVASLLPVLSLVSDGGGRPSSELEKMFLDLLAFVNIAPSLVSMLIMIVAAIFLKSVLTMAAMSMVGSTIAKITLVFRHRLINALIVARWPYFITQPMGSLANALGVEAHNAGSAITGSFQIVANSIQVSVYMLLAFVLNPYITLFSLAVGIFLITAFSGLVAFSRRAGLRNTQANEALQTIIVDGLSGIKPLRAMARERRLKDLLVQEATNVFQAQRHLIFSKEALAAVREPVLFLALAPMIYVAMTHLGMPFEQLLILAYLFYRTINSVSNLQQVYQGMVGVENFHRSMQDKIKTVEGQAEQQAGPELPPLQEIISLKNLSLNINGTDILTDISLDIPANLITAIVGPSGAGKTSLVDNILGFHKPTGGEILIDGEPITKYNVLSWRKQIGYVPQEMLLFHDTVRNNVTLGDSRYSDDDVERALRDAGAWDFVQETPDKLQTVVGERGARLSGGQRQRIAIARALLSNPKLLILDEPTTALDPAMEAEICKSLKLLAKKVTILLISHQPSLIAISDKVIHLSNGRVADAA